MFGNAIASAPQVICDEIERQVFQSAIFRLTAGLIDSICSSTGFLAVPYVLPLALQPLFVRHPRISLLDYRCHPSTFDLLAKPDTVQNLFDSFRTEKQSLSFQIPPFHHHICFPVVDDFTMRTGLRHRLEIWTYCAR